MGAMQRRKGATGERELRQLLKDELGEGIERNLDQVRDGGHDLLGLPPFAVEVKRRQRVTECIVRHLWGEAAYQARGAIPALAYRADRAPWRVVLPMYAVDVHQLGTPSHDHEWTVEVSVPAFCAVVREHMAAARANNGG